MSISSLGVGSGVLTSTTLDQLKAVDETAKIQPIDLNLALEKDKKNALEIVDAKMTNLIDSITALKTPALYDERQATVKGTSVEVTASPNSDLQSFTLDVTQLATKEINGSGAFGASNANIATANGSMTLDIKDAAGNITTTYTVDYTSTMTLDDLKNSINSVAGKDLSASVVKVANGDYRLFLNSVNEGADQNISITDISGNLSDDGGTTAGGVNLTTGISTVQNGLDAKFSYNGQAIQRGSNNISDLITGYNITLKELGSSTVSVEQNRTSIIDKIDSFVSQYNAAMDELAKVTKNSTDAATRGIFASDSNIKSMQRDVRNILDTMGGGVANIYDYGFDIDKSGRLSFNSTVFNAKLDTSTTNTEAFFSGGNYTNANGTVTTINGAFNDMAAVVENYTKYNKTLDLFKNDINDRISSLENSKTLAQKRLDTKYATLAKQWAAYDSVINRTQSSSSLFTQLINAGKNTTN